MRNRKRNHQKETSETDVTNQTKYLNLTCVRAKRPERPKQVQQNKQYNLPMVETSKRWKVEEISSMSVRLLSRSYVGNFWKRHFWQLSFCRRGLASPFCERQWSWSIHGHQRRELKLNCLISQFSRVNVVFVKKFSSLFSSVFFFCFSWQTAFWSFALHCDSWRKNLGTVWFSY